MIYVNRAAGKEFHIPFFRLHARYPKLSCESAWGSDADRHDKYLI